MIPAILALDPVEMPLLDDGVVAEAPLPHWELRLPGVRPNAATHSERGRPAADAEFLYLGSASESALLQIRRINGEVVERYPTHAPVQAEPLILGSTLIVVDGAGYTTVYQLGSKTPIWEHFGGAPIPGRPLLDGDQLIVANVDDVVYALDISTGLLRWRYARPADVTRGGELTLFGAPSPTLAGQNVLVGFKDGHVAALDPRSGEIVWERAVGEGRYPDIIATPLVEGRTAYVGGYSEPLVALDLETRAPTWRLDVGSADAPAIDGARLYHGATDGKLRAIDRLSGEVIWTWDSGTMGALTHPQLLPAGVLVGSSDGGLYLVDTLSGALEWSWDPGYLLDGITVAPLVAGRQVVALTNAGNLLSFLAPQPPPEIIEEFPRFF